MPAPWTVGTAAAGLALTAACSSNNSFPTFKLAEPHKHVAAADNGAATSLAGYLEQGQCKIDIVVTDPAEATPANVYIKANDAPTAACPHPDVLLGKGDFSTITTGDVLDNGGIAILYSF